MASEKFYHVQSLSLWTSAISTDLLLLVVCYLNWSHSLKPNSNMQSSNTWASKVSGDALQKFRLHSYRNIQQQRNKSFKKLLHYEEWTYKVNTSQRKKKGENFSDSKSWKVHTSCTFLLNPGSAPCQGKEPISFNNHSRIMPWFSPLLPPCMQRSIKAEP